MKGGFLHGESAIPVKSVLLKLGEEVVNKLRPSRVEQRLFQEHERKGPALGIFTTKWTKHSRSSNALSYEQLGSCAELVEANVEFAREKSPGTFTKKSRQSKKELYIQACENFFRPPSRTTQGKVVASRSVGNVKNREFMVDRGASLHMMSKNELTSGATVITTASGKAESKEDEKCLK